MRKFILIALGLVLSACTIKAPTPVPTAPPTRTVTSAPTTTATLTPFRPADWTPEAPTAGPGTSTPTQTVEYSLFSNGVKIGTFTITDGKPSGVKFVPIAAADAPFQATVAKVQWGYNQLVTVSLGDYDIAFEFSGPTLIHNGQEIGVLLGQTIVMFVNGQVSYLFRSITGQLEAGR